MSSNLRTGGQILVDALKLHGVDTAFCVPGESYLATLDALHDAQDAIRLVVCRQEGGAAYAAEAYAKLTGKPGVCFVTRGPGATNASVGIHTARQDSTPVILLVGQVARGMSGREAFQEIDFRRMYGEMVKWVEQIDDPARVPEMISRAFHVASSGRPGPVLLALPEDMQSEPAAAADGTPYQPVQASPSSADMAKLRDMLSQAKRPLVLLGGSGWDTSACADIARFAEVNNLPVTAAFRRQDLYDNRKPNYAGVVGLGMNAKLRKTVEGADLVLVIGAQLTEIVTQGYTLFDFPHPRQKMIHVAAGIEELGKVHQADLLINAGMGEFAAAAAALDAVDGAGWAGLVKQAHDDYEATTRPVESAGALNMSEVMGWLDANLPDDAIMANGAGNFSIWVHRFFHYKKYGTQLAPQSGSMGYGVPAGVAAGLVHPDRQVVSFSGDGCFLMNGQEIATAAANRLNVVFCVVNNAMYGTIRMHQERHYPARVSGTDLVNPDFAALASAYGLHGEVVNKTADFAPAFERATQAEGPALIELRVDPEDVVPGNTVTGLREAALNAGS
ncbi:MAG: thiamine pyrophosphate-binding protein [Alphaproteobacteria bacterium]